MENSKKVLIIMMVVIILIIAIVLALIFNQKPQDDKYKIGELSNNTNVIEKDNEISETPSNIGTVLEKFKPLDNADMFYSLSNCIQRYLNYNNVKLETRENLTIEAKEEIIYNILNDNYKRKNNITRENIKTYMDDEEYELAFYQMSVMQLVEDNIGTYIIYGLIENAETGKYIEDAHYIIRIDNNNTSFDIEPIENNINDIKINTDIKSIQKNDNNNFITSTVNTDSLVKRYLANYSKMAQFYPEKAYEYFDEEYRNKRFGSLDNFKKYVQNNKGNIENIILDRYQRTEEDNYTQYVCVDTNGNYYIFRETAIMQYTLILDTYTIDIPEFTNKYNSSNTQEKVRLNINKFMLALNDKNYKYAYSVLVDNLKTQNFKTEEDFENYVKTNFFQKNSFSYEEFSDESGTYYTYKVQVKDITGTSSKALTKTFIVLLEDGTNFKLSFNV